MDADLQDPPALLHEMYEILESGDMIVWQQEEFREKENLL